MRKWVLVSILSCFFLLLTIGAIWYYNIANYANQNTIPEGVTADKLDIGGMKINEALIMLDAYENGLKDRKITITSDQFEPNHKQWTLQDLQFQAEFRNARQTILQLQEGTIWEKYEYRKSFPSHFELTVLWNHQVLFDHINNLWGNINETTTINATRSITEDDQVVYTSHQNAYRLNADSIVNEVNQWIYLLVSEPELQISLPVVEIDAPITLEGLKEEGINEIIMTFSTNYSTSSNGRAHNVELAATTLHDTILAPGDVFSYAALIEQAEQEGEFREAPVIVNGKLEQGIGGGVCQVSSTLYQAILRSGFEIVERRNHSIPVSYLPLGQDATYTSSGIDFKFRNNSDHYLLIRTESQNGTLTVKLFGTMSPENKTYDIVSVTESVIKPAVKKVTNSSLSKGASIVRQNGKNGYIVNTYRIHKVDGIEQSREKISTDTYRMQPTIIEVGA